MDGRVRPPLLTDHDRFRRVIFDSGVIRELDINADKGAVAFQRPDDSFAYYRASIDVRNKTLTLNPLRHRSDPDPDAGHRDWNAQFTFERQSADQLVLDGDMNHTRCSCSCIFLTATSSSSSIAAFTGCSESI